MATRNTVQHGIVLDALCTLANHPTADQVYDLVHLEYPSISKATVYRVLNKLVDEGMAARVRINNGADRFDHQAFPHFHSRCSCCGKVDDVLLDLPANLCDIAAQSSGYTVQSFELQFDGICPACQTAR